MNKPVLLVMAAGMGGRYGGLKQIDSIGNNGELMIDFSLYDAYTSGFREVIFVVREEILADFKDIIGKRISGKLNAQYAIQSLNDLPESYAVPNHRTKPWGTGHAVYSARHLLKNRPFMVINADDYYGPDAFQEIFAHLSKENADPQEYAMVSYQLKNTITPNGHVARGVCTVDKNSYLVDIIERTNIQQFHAQIKFTLDNGTNWTNLSGDTPVSLNCWGFTANIIEEIESDFPLFLQHKAKDNPTSAEYFLPSIIESLIKSKKIKVNVLKSKDRWYGVTYKEDKHDVSTALNEMKKSGIYPHSLWD